MARRIGMVVGGVLALGLLVVLAIPMLLGDRLATRLEAVLDEAMLADTSFDDVSVGLLSTFPDLRVEIDGARIVGEGRFADVRLLSASRVVVEIDLWSALFSDQPRVEQILIDGAVLDMRVAADGSSNLDLFPPDQTEGELEPWSAALEQFEVRDLQLSYVDVPAGVDVAIGDLDLQVSGTIGSDGSVLSVAGSATPCSAHQGSGILFDKAAWSVRSSLVSDADGVLTLEDTEVKLDGLALRVEGTVAPRPDGTELDLAVSAPEASVAGVLSLLPSVLAGEVGSLAADGTASVTGSVRGLLPNDGDELPAFTADVRIDDGRFQVPVADGDPVKVRDLDVTARLEHPQGTLDELVVEVSRFAVAARQTTLEGTLRVARPMSDPLLDGRASGTLALAELDALWPGAAGGASGAVELDVQVKGAMSALSAGDVSAIHAEGRISGRGLDYVNPSMSVVPWRVEELDVRLAGPGATLEALDLTWASADGRSDLSISGVFDRFLGYFLADDGVLSGRVALSGDHTDIRAWSASPDDAEVDSDLAGVPSAIVVSCELSFGHLATTALALDDVRGTMAIADGVATLDGLRGNLWGGTVELDGRYAVTDLATVDLTVRTVQVDLARLVSEFGSLRRIAPVLDGAVGKLDSSLSVSSRLLPDGTPLLATLTSTGNLRALGLQLSPVILREAAQRLGSDDVATLDLGKSRIGFDISGGRLALKPFSLSLGPWTASGSGSAQILNEEFNVAFVAPVPVRKLAGSQLLASLGADVPGTVDVEVRVKGPYSAPKLSVAALGVRDAIEARVDEVVDQARDAALEAARARADALMKEVTARVEAIRAEAATGASRLRAEAEEEGDRLVEASGANLVKRALARESARVLTEQADKAARRVEREAEQTASRLLAEAEAKKARWLAEASE